MTQVRHNSSINPPGRRPFPQVLRSHRAAIVGGILILLAVVVRLIGLSLDSLWYDEVFSVRAARISFSEIIRLATSDVHPPLYSLLLHFWIKLFGETESAVRLLSVCFSVLTVLVIYRLALKLFNHRVAFFAALFTTLSPLHVFYAQEARGYAQLTFLAATSVYFFVCWLEDGRRISAALYALSTVLLLYTHIYAAFVVLAQLVYFASLFFLAREAFQKRLGSWLAIQFITGVVFFPWMLIIIRQALKARRGFWIEEPDWLAPFQTLIEYCGSLWLALLILPLFVYGLKRCFKPSDKDPIDSLPHLGAFLLLWLILPIGVPFFLSKLTTPFYLTKYTIAASLPFYLFAACGLDRVRGAAWQAILVLLICVGFGTELSRDLSALKRERWRDAAYNLEQAAQPGDLVLFNSTGSYMSFAYYAKRKDMNSAVFPYSATDEQPPSELISLQRYIVEGFGSVHPPQTEQETKEKLQTIVGERRRVWIVTRYGTGFKDDFMRVFGDEFQIMTQPPLCVSQRRFLFTETDSTGGRSVVLQRRGLSCATQAYLLER